MAKVKLKTALVQKNKVAKAGDTVNIPDAQAKYLISIGRAEAVTVKVKEEKATKKTKELKTNKDTKDA